MRISAFVALLLSTTATLAIMGAQSSQRPVQTDRAQALGALPKPGNLADILSCAGANEVLWTSALKSDPRDPRGHEAKRKAGWYSAVALWIFDVDSSAVVEAVGSASRRERASVLALAETCRRAPDNWRE